jgi:hypothetical protein
VRGFLRRLLGGVHWCGGVGVWERVGMTRRTW